MKNYAPTNYDIWESRICIVGLMFMAALLVFNYAWALKVYGE